MLSLMMWKNVLFLLTGFIVKHIYHVEAWVAIPSTNTRLNRATLSYPIETNRLFLKEEQQHPGLYMSGDSNDSEENENEVIEITSLSNQNLHELIELSFLKACLGMSKGDVEPVQLFIASVKVMANRQPSCSQLIQDISSIDTERPLDVQEENVRNTWIQAIYLLLGHIGSESIIEEAVDQNVAEIYGPVLDDIIAIQKSRLGLNTENFVESRKSILLTTKETPSNPLLLQPESNDPLEVALVSQTIKILYYTLLITAEADPSDENKSAREPIEKRNAKKNTKDQKKNRGGRGFG